MPLTPTPPTFTLQLFLDFLFFVLLTFSKGEINHRRNRKFSESTKSCSVKVGGVSVEGMMAFKKIGALV